MTMVFAMIFVTIVFSAVATPCSGDKGTFDVKNVVFPDELEIGVQNWFSKVLIKVLFALLAGHSSTSGEMVLLCPNIPGTFCLRAILSMPMQCYVENATAHLNITFLHCIAFCIHQQR